jgi:hypothetical protein
MEEYLLSKKPQINEFSYETMCHTKILTNEYEFCIAIPQSKKYVGYITLIQEQPATSSQSSSLPPAEFPFYPVLIIYELNRFRKISNIFKVATVNYTFCEIAGWLEETIFYGSIVNGFFIIEDILYYKGQSLRNAIYKEKIEVMLRILSLSEQFDYLPTTATAPPTQQQTGTNTEFTDIHRLKLVLPMFFKNTEQTSIELQHIPYPIHHIQYRSLMKLKPILNVSIARNGVLEFENQEPQIVLSKNKLTTTTIKKHSPPISPHSYFNKNGHSFVFNKPQYKKRTVFEVVADIQYDVYLLYAYNNVGKQGGGDKHVFVDIAFISNYQTSKMMNGIFRKIKENVNLDYIEESDDEDDFENAEPDKYVDLNKKVNMECQFNYKFKKWMPIRVVDSSINQGKIVPVSNL